MAPSRRTRPPIGILLAALVLSGCAGAPSAPPATTPAPPATDPDPADPGQVWLSEDQRLYFYPPERGLTVGFFGHNTAEDMSFIIAHNATVIDFVVDDAGETITAREQTVYHLDIDGEFVNIPMEVTLSYLTEPDGTLHLPASRFMGAGASFSGDAWVTIPGPERLLTGPFSDTTTFTMNTGGDTTLAVTLDYTVTSGGWLNAHQLGVTFTATAHSTLMGGSGSDGPGAPMQITVDWVFQPGYGLISETVTTTGDGINSTGVIEHNDIPANLSEFFN